MARSRIGKSLRHAWNAFVADREDTVFARENQFSRFYGQSSGRPSGSVALRQASDKTILTAIYVKIAVDAAGAEFRHIRTDDDGLYKEDIKSGLNDCLTVEANIDQASIAFFLDIYLSMFDNGYLAILPTDTTINPELSGGWDVLKMRVAEIVEFMPQHVRISAYDERDGQRKQLVVGKKEVAVVYNPFFPVMNDSGSVVKRLVRKLAILDTVDEASASGKLDMLIQLPYTVRGKTKIKQAEDRHALLEQQLQDSSLGIGYIDATEKVIQLNRPVENSLLNQVEYLMNLLFSQLGLTPEIMNGTADEAVMLNYYNRTIGPLNDAVRQGMIRSFLTKTARTQNQSIIAFRDPWKSIPLSKMGELINSLSRNEVVTANEIRPKIGLKPHSDPNANKLINSNMPGGNAVADPGASQPEAPADNTALFDQMNGILDGAFKDLGVDENAV